MIEDRLANKPKDKDGLLHSLDGPMFSKGECDPKYDVWYVHGKGYPVVHLETWPLNLYLAYIKWKKKK
jgi:hypothetical protein